MFLVIGATGTIGGETARQLASRGAPVRALVRNPAKADALAAAGIEIVTGDLSQPETLPPAFSAVHQLLLVTSASDRLAEVQGRAIAAARDAGVRHVVKVSTIGAMPGSKVRLGRLHAEVEQTLKASGVGWTILQPNFFFQNFLQYGPAVAATGLLRAAVGPGGAAAVDARDIAAAAVVALTTSGHEGQTYVVTGAEPLTYAAAAAHLAAALGREVRFEPQPVDEARQQMLAAGTPDWLVEDLLTLQDIYGKGYAARTSPAVEQLTGRPPRRFADFVRDHLAFFSGAAAGEVRATRPAAHGAGLG